MGVEYPGQWTVGHFLLDSEGRRVGGGGNPEGGGGGELKNYCGWWREVFSEREMLFPTISATFWPIEAHFSNTVGGMNVTKSLIHVY